MAQPTLLGLPVEIREIIFKHLLTFNNNPIRICDPQAGKREGYRLTPSSTFYSEILHKLEPSILQVCSAFNLSGSKPLYSENLFTFQNVKTLKYFLWMINSGGKSQKSHLLRQLRITIGLNVPELWEWHEFWESQSTVTCLQGLRSIELDCFPLYDTKPDDKFRLWMRATCEKLSRSIETGSPADCVIVKTYLRTVTW
ncbi:hypothetical protein MMC13_000692 [Lambiella insularis]|nr:hypothetical protein [Lambiella insularis]